MSSVQKGKKKYYVAEPPERLLGYAKGRVQALESTLQEMSERIHDLKMIQSGEKPVVKLYEGKDALKAIHDDILRSGTDYVYEVGNLKDVREHYTFDSDVENFFKQVEQRGVKRNYIWDAGDINPVKRSEHEHIYTLEPNAQHNIHGHIVLYKNKLALSTLQGKHITVMIENQVLTDTLRGLLDLLKKNLQKH